MVDDVIEKFKYHKSLCLQLSTGGGKCLAKDTPILMYDGTIKKVQDVIVGDVIMGDDSSPRNILSLARGRENMYKITPKKGDSITVNESHILSLKVTGIKEGLPYNGNRYYKGDIIDISVYDYLKQNKTFKHCTKHYRTSIDFNEKELPIDPYFIGLWLGDGTSSSLSITTMDSEIIEYLDDFVSINKHNSYIEEQEGNKSIIYHISNDYKRGGVLTKMKDLNLINNKHIPLIYKTSSRDQRLRLLAGILDSDGYLNKGTGFDVIFKNEILANDLAYLCRSLGFSAYISKARKGCWYKGEYKSNIYNRVSISGDCSLIPNILERNKAKKRIKDKDVLVCGFDIDCIGVGDYYGFEIDGNRRFVLGDFTVTHNTVVFSFLCKEWIKNNTGKILILCHRSELIEQSAETLVKLGLTYEKILPTTKRLHHSSDVYIAMIETLDRRLKKNPFYLKNVSLIIADEAHVQIFNKVYNFFDNAKILGVTATPVLLGRDTYFKCPRCKSVSNDVYECCGFEAEEWSRPKRMIDVYEEIVTGPNIDFLIEFGQLVKEINFVEHFTDLSLLEVDQSGDFSNKSQDNAFGSDESAFNVLLNYENIAKGKKTIIFNNSTKTNLKVYEQFKEAGYENVRLYDSVNDSGESRKSVVKWFKDTEDAILLNCGVFVAGFDEKSATVCILNVATTSLSRFLQMVGRVGRACDYIYKPNAIVIDGGGNIERFNIWSDPTRDWDKIFREGIGKDRAKKESPLSVSQCEECGFLFPRSQGTCPECGHTVPTRVKPEQAPGETILTPIDKIPLPNGHKIAKYAISRGEDKHFAFKVMYEQVLDLFRFNLVSKEQYLSNKADGRLLKRLGEIIRPVYFVLWDYTELVSPSNRTLKYVINKCIEKLDKYYGIQKDS